MRDITSRVVARFLRRSVGLPDGAPPERLLHDTKRLLRALKAGIVKRLHVASAHEQQVLTELLKALGQYDPSKSPSVAFEKEFQFILVLAAKELDAEFVDDADVSDLTKRLKRHLGVG